MKKIIVLAAIVLLSSLSVHTFAAEGDVTTAPGGDVTTAPGGDTTTAPGGDVTTAPNRLGDPNEIDTVDDVLNVIDRITNWMFTIFLAAAVIMILYAAFTYLTSGGGEEVAKAHKMILYSAVAIAVAVLAKGVVNVVKSIVTP